MSGAAIITGASGFVGRHLCVELRKRGIPSVALVRPNSKMTQADHHVEVADPTDAASLERALTAIRPRAVFHLAGSSVEASLADLYRANTLYGAALLAALERLEDSPVVVVAGSAAEYGPAAPGLVSEDTICRPITSYGITKLAQTHHALAAKGAKVIIARLFNPVGPGMPTHLALGRFAVCIAEMDCKGGILETGLLDVERDFFDVAGGVSCLVELTRVEGAQGQIVNICSGIGTNLRMLTERLISASGKSVRIVEHDSRGSETRAITTFIGDPARMKSLGILPPQIDIDRIVLQLLPQGAA